VSKDQIHALAHEVHPFAIEVRRHLHQHPELSFEERETSAYVAAHLRQMGYEPEEGVGGYGVRLVIRGAKPGPTIALRADMDALPIQEETGLPFASLKSGVMHACGHDMHTAILLATAKAVKVWEGELSGNLVFLFQPAEEQPPGGAQAMIKAGALQNPSVDAIFGLHVNPLLPVGRMAFGAGAAMAASDRFTITIRGKGGHGAYPQNCIDPILTAAQVVTLLQQIVARNVGPFQQAVVTVGMMHAGTARNVIPDICTLGGTVRTLDPGLYESVPRRLEEVVRGVCEATGATYELEYTRGYPALVNHEKETGIARAVAEHLFGQDRIGQMTPRMGGEDFAFYLREVPGTFGHLGALPPNHPDPVGLHNGRLMLDEAAMPVGVAYYLGLIQHYLRA
jgi:amidohydrolase